MMNSYPPAVLKFLSTMFFLGVILGFAEFMCGGSWDDTVRMFFAPLVIVLAVAVPAVPILLVSWAFHRLFK